MNTQQLYNQQTHGIIGAAIEVHRNVGPGLLESAYQACMAYELGKRGFHFEREKPIPLIYGDVDMKCGYRTDFVIEGQIVLELKAKTEIHPIDEAQLLSYLRLLNLRVGLLINFHETKLVDGVRRMVNGY